MRFTSRKYVLLVSGIVLSTIILLPLSNILFPKANAAPNIPVQLRFYSFSQIDNPDGWPRENGEYYFRVTIASPGLPPTILESHLFDIASLTDPNGIWTTSPVPVDRARGNIVTIGIQLIDEDLGTGYPNDIMDINPTPGAQTITLGLDLDSGTISGSVSGLVNERLFSNGNGDFVSDTEPLETNGEIAQITEFTVAVTGFHGWENVGNTFGQGGPGSSSPVLGRWDVFQRGPGNTLEWTRLRGGSSEWSPLTVSDEPYQSIASGPDAVSSRPGRIDLFAEGPNGVLLHKYNQNRLPLEEPMSRFTNWGWTRWEQFSNIHEDYAPYFLDSGPAVSTRGSNRFDVFVVGAGGDLHWLEYTGRPDPIWYQLGDIDPQRGSDPAAVSSDPSRIDVFVRGDDNQLYRKWCDYDLGKPCNNGMSGAAAVRGWSSWELVGPSLRSSPGKPAPEELTSGPAVASFAPDRLDVFVVGRDSQLYHTWTNNSGRTWGPWEPIGGPIAAGSDPEAVSFRFQGNLGAPGPQRVDVFARGESGIVMHTWWVGGR